MTERMTYKQFKAEQAKKGNKFNAQSATVHGIKFHSKKEANRYLLLKDREARGEIECLELQVSIPLFGRDGPIMTPTGKQQATYVADFRYIDWTLNGVRVVEDAKGMETGVFKLKRAILEAQNVSLLIT